MYNIGVNGHIHQITYIVLVECVHNRPMYLLTVKVYITDPCTYWQWRCT